ADPVTFDDYLHTGAIFPAERWRAPEGTKFRDAESAIFRRLATLPPEDGHAPLHRLQHIKLLMAQEHYPEARAMINRLIAEAPEVAIQHRVHALKGMIHFMFGEYEE